MRRNRLREALDEVRRAKQEVTIRSDPSADAVTRVADYFEPFNIDVVVESGDAADEGPDIPAELASLLSSTTVCCEPSPELAESWFVLFTSEETTAGMFAVATEDGEGQRFDGCWTYREDLIRRMGEHLSERYEARSIPN